MDYADGKGSVSHVYHPADAAGREGREGGRERRREGGGMVRDGWDGKLNGREERRIRIGKDGERDLDRYEGMEGSIRIEMKGRRKGEVFRI